MSGRFDPRTQLPDGATPPGFQNEKTGELFTDAAKIDQNTILQRGDFRIVSYEWGVTYRNASASEATGDTRYREYVEKRLASSRICGGIPQAIGAL